MMEGQGLGACLVTPTPAPSGAPWGWDHEPGLRFFLGADTMCQAVLGKQECGPFSPPPWMRVTLEGFSLLGGGRDFLPRAIKGQVCVWQGGMGDTPVCSGQGPPWQQQNEEGA